MDAIQCVQQPAALGYLPEYLVTQVERWIKERDHKDVTSDQATAMIVDFHVSRGLPAKLSDRLSDTAFSVTAKQTGQAQTTVRDKVSLKRRNRRGPVTKAK